MWWIRGKGKPVVDRSPLVLLPQRRSTPRERLAVGLADRFARLGPYASVRALTGLPLGMLERLAANVLSELNIGAGPGGLVAVESTQCGWSTTCLRCGEYQSFREEAGFPWEKVRTEAILTAEGHACPDEAALAAVLPTTESWTPTISRPTSGVAG